MKISTKGRYGLRAMIDIAVNSNGEQVSLNNIADRQNISENYLEQVFSVLRKAGLVKSVKGAQGGYVLSKTPGSITVGDVLRALEGDLSIIDSDISGLKGERTIESILSSEVWDKINESITEVVDSITLEDLTEEFKKINGIENLMFYI